MTASNKEAFSEYQSLAVLLEFLTRLDESEDVKKKLIEKIEKKVKGYVKDDGKFATEQATSGYLLETIKKSKELRRNIFKPERLNTFDQYSELMDPDANKYTELLINNIFALFGCLYYMYFECCRDCTCIDGGGEWYDERCDGIGRYQYLNEWLKDQKPSTETSEDATETSEDGTKRMIQRGFKQDELSNKKGEELFPNEEHEKDRSNRLLNYEYGAQLQFCLYYMLFLPTKWNRGQSGHAVLFLEAFCEKVSKNKFSGQYTEADEGQGFKKACQKVQESINKLLQSQHIVPVAWSPKVNYKDLLEAKHFWDYITWLEKNLQGLIKSLTEMANDAKNWNYTELVSSETFGPYPWGFTFKDHNWDQKKGKLQRQLNGPLSQLTEALGGLKKALPSASEAKSVSKSDTEKPSNSTESTGSTTSHTSTISAENSSAPTVSTTSTVFTTSHTSTDSTNSTASTIGGVAGGLGAAAATGAAAYAGSGFLGPVADAVGKFFKGLLW